MAAEISNLNIGGAAGIECLEHTLGDGNVSSTAYLMQLLRLQWLKLEEHTLQLLRLVSKEARDIISSQLLTLRASSATRIDDAALFVNLTDLDLSDCAEEELTDATLKALTPRLSPCLTCLNLAGESHSQLTPLGLTALTSLTALRLLAMDGCPAAAAPPGLSALGRLTSLTSLSLNGCSVTDEGLEGLSMLTNLAHLDLRRCKLLTDQGMPSLFHMASLTSLNLGGGLTNVASHLPGLRSLDLSLCPQVADTALADLTCKLTALTCLNLSMCERLTDEGLVSLAPLTSLASLDISLCKDLTDAAVGALPARHNALTHLNVSMCEQLGDRTVYALTCPSGARVALRELVLRGCARLTDAGLRTLAAHRDVVNGLTYLNLSVCPGFSEEWLASIGNLRALARLDLGMNQLTDTGLAKLSPLTDLVELVLERCNGFGDPGLVHVGALRSLTSLNLSMCKNVSRTGLVGCIQRLKALTRLNLYGCTAADEFATLLHEIRRTVSPVVVENHSASASSYENRIISHTATTLVYLMGGTLTENPLTPSLTMLWFIR
eukprot:gene12785-15113_t